MHFLYSFSLGGGQNYLFAPQLRGWGGGQMPLLPPPPSSAALGCKAARPLPKCHHVSAPASWPAAMIRHQRCSMRLSCRWLSLNSGCSWGWTGDGYTCNCSALTCRGAERWYKAQLTLGEASVKTHLPTSACRVPVGQLEKQQRDFEHKFNTKTVSNAQFLLVWLSPL